MSTTERRRPPGRYDEPRRSARVLTLVGAVVLGLVISLGAVALYQRNTQGKVPYQLRGYAVSSDTAVKVSWEVTLGSGRYGKCAVRARGRSGAIVGSELVPIGPGTGRTAVLDHVLTTTARASSAEISACREVPAP